jgi:hypothetical protein
MQIDRNIYLKAKLLATGHSKQSWFSENIKLQPVARMPTSTQLLASEKHFRCIYMPHFNRSMLVVAIVATPFSFWLAHLQYGATQPLTQFTEVTTLTYFLLQMFDLLFAK